MWSIPKAKFTTAEIKTRRVVLKAQSVKNEKAILETGSMFDLVYSTNTLYARLVLIYRALIQAIWMKSTNRAGKLSTLSMAPSALTDQYMQNLWRGHVDIQLGRKYPRIWQKKHLFEEDRFEDIQALQILSTKIDKKSKMSPRFYDSRRVAGTLFNFRPQHSGSIMQNLKSRDCSWEDPRRFRGRSWFSLSAHYSSHFWTLIIAVQYVGSKCCNYYSTFRCRFLVNNVFAVVSIWRGSSFVVLVAPQTVAPCCWNWRRALA